MRSQKPPSILDSINQQLEYLNGEVDSLCSDVSELSFKLDMRENVRIDGTDKLLEHSLLLSVLLFRAIKEDKGELLDMAEQELHALLKTAVDSKTNLSVSSRFWQRLIDACGDTYDTRSLKSSIK